MYDTLFFKAGYFQQFVTSIFNNFEDVFASDSTIIGPQIIIHHHKTGCVLSHDIVKAIKHSQNNFLLNKNQKPIPKRSGICPPKTHQIEKNSFFYSNSSQLFL